MKRAAALAAVLACVIVSTPAVAQDQSDPFIDDLERSIVGWLDRYETPTAGVAVVEDGETVHTDYFSSSETGPRGGDLFEVASLSKTATAVAVLRLAEMDRIDLEAPVDDYLERWSVPSSRYDASEVTARRLLSHTAGFPFDASEAPSFGSGSVPSALELLEDTTLVARPGAEFNYSNPGYTVLELLIEDVTGDPFPVAMRELVFEPLRMGDTGFQDDDDLVRRVAPGHQRMDHPTGLLLRERRAAGGMISSPGDIASLFTAVSVPEEDGGFLRSATLERMQAPPSAAKDAFGLGDDGGYGLGVAVGPLGSRGKSFVANNGSHTGFNAFALMVPGDDHGLVVLTNARAGIGVELEAALRWFDVVPRAEPRLASRFEMTRTGLRWFTFAAIALCVIYVIHALWDVRRGRRTRGRPLRRRVFSVAIPLVLLAAVVVVVFNTGAVTGSLGGVPAARFISADYDVFVWALAAGLLLAAATAVLFRRAARRG